MPIIFNILLIQSLSAQTGNKSKLIILNLAEAFSRQQEVPLSRFVNKITYVPLETKQESLISSSPNIEVSDDFVIVKNGGQSKNQILLFDRNTGKFIREIGKQGRGPGEYMSVGFIPFNPVNKEVYAISASREILTYDLSGNNIDKIKIPEFKDTKMVKADQTPAQNALLSKIMLTFYAILDSNIFVGYVQNFSGWENRKLVLLSNEGVLKIFPNYLTWDREKGNGFLLPPGGFAKFYRWDNKLNFIETFCDTIYQVTKSSLIPRYFFDWGKFNAPYSKQVEVAKDWYNFFFISNISENKNYIFFQLWYSKEVYTGFIEKKNNNITICKIGNSDKSALKDDLTGLMDVTPTYFTQTNEMVNVIQPGELLKWFKENPEKAEKAKKQLPWLTGIDEFSNPIIAIAKCKD